MIIRAFLRVAFMSAALTAARPAAAQQPVPVPPIARTDLMKQTLPPGDFRTVQAVIIELQPGATAALHRHDVAVLAYMLEGEVENRFNGGATVTHRAGESWWEAPGTVHDVARNPSATAKARFLVVYVAEDGKANTVPLGGTRPPDR
jgi:quercetin dioxygenase-like cupin family protein